MAEFIRSAKNARPLPLYNIPGKIIKKHCVYFTRAANAPTSVNASYETLS